MPSALSRRVRCSIAAAAAVAIAFSAGCTTNENPTTQNVGSSNTAAVPTTAAGKAATGTPIKIGWVNGEKGPTGLPDITAGAKIGVDRVNKHEDGINGHPIDLVTCATDGTPEASAQCANQFVADGVVAVVSGSDLGTDAMIPILTGAGIALMGGGTLGTGQTLNTNAFFFAPPATGYAQAQIDLAATIGAKNVTMVFPNVPQVPVLQKLAEDQGKLDGVAVKVVTFDQAAPDFAASMAAVTANGSDAIATINTDDWCTGLARAAMDANFTGSMIMGVCSKFNNEVDVSRAKGVYVLGPGWAPQSRQFAPPEANAVMDEYAAAMAEAGRASDIPNTIFFGGYAAIDQVAGVLRTLGNDLTTESVMTGMKNLTAAPNPLGQPISCSPRPYAGTSACAKGWLFLQMIDKQTAKPLTNEFIPVRTA